MALTEADVEKVADLARLELAPEEKAAYQEQLSKVLDYVALLDELDLEDVPPTAQAVSRQNVLREDEVAPSLPTEDALYNAPRQAEDQFLIQSVLDG